MQEIRFHVPTSVARAIGLRTSAHYESAADDTTAPLEVTALSWTHVTAIECNVSTARLIIDDIKRAGNASADLTFRASCASAVDAIEMAILDTEPRTGLRLDQPLRIGRPLRRRSSP